MLLKIRVALLVLSLALNLQAQTIHQHLSELKQTEFALTLGHEIHPDKNAIYCSTLLLAWDGLRNNLGGSIEVDSVDRELYLLNHSKDFENTLLKNEYVSWHKIAFNSIHVKAEFKKSLPLLVRMSGYASELVFDGKEVPSFSDKGEGKESVDVRYYKDDNNVIVSLLLQNPSHELLLFKTESKFRTMREAVFALEESLKAGHAEMQGGTNTWKFDFTKDDNLIIPKIKFDIKTEYPSMEEKVVYSGRTRLDVMEVSQRIGFSLNEKGVETESTGYVHVALKQPVQDDARKPKKIIFDKPFFIFLKRKESVNPYLVLWIANAELMK